MFRKLLNLSALIAASAFALSACGKAETARSAGQVVVRVNGGAITAQQVKHAIARTGRVAPEQARQAAAEVIERIIDEELLVQKALKERLERDPGVQQAIEAARRQTLARAAIERAVVAASPGSLEEVRRFYRDHPALFERRRLYRVNELVVPEPEEKLAALKAAAADAKNLGEVAGWLKAQRLTFHAVTSSKPAEQIPMTLLPQVSGMQDGQIAVVPASAGVSVLQLLQSEEAPLSEPQAAPIISRYLRNRKRLELAQEAITKLRQQAKIEYVGKFTTTHAALR